MQDQLQKVIKLAKKTGDRLIVFDPDHDDMTYVVMAVEDYERLVVKNSEVKGLTEDELLDKINRNIAIWKSEQDYVNEIDTNFIKESVKEQLANKAKPKEFSGDCLDGIDFLPDFGGEKLDESKGAEEEGSKKRWAIPSNRKSKAEEIVDEDENTQYLEEITF